MGLFSTKPKLEEIDITKLGKSLISIQDPIETRALRFQQDFDEVRIENMNMLNIESYYIYSILRFKGGVYLQVTDEVIKNYTLGTITHSTKFSINGYIDDESFHFFLKKLNDTYDTINNNVWLMNDGSLLKYKYKTNRSIYFEYEMPK